MSRIALIFAALVVLAAPAAAKDEVLWNAPLAKGQRLAIEGVVGEISIRTTTSKTARVTATRSSRNDRAELRTIEGKDVVSIRVSYPGEKHDIEEDDGNVDFVVELPAGVALDASTVVGSIEADLSGKVRPSDLMLQTVNGSIRVEVEEGFDAELDANVVNGSLETEIPVINGKRGRTSWNGRLGSGGPKLELRTVNGRIDLIRAS